MQVTLPPGDGASTRIRLPRAQRREQLLQTAAAMFAQRGYASSSMEELAAAAGVSKPILYDHFGSKEGILTACVDRATETLSVSVLEATAGIDDAEEILRVATLTFFRFIDEHESSWAILLDPRIPHGPEYEDQATRVRQRVSAFTASIFEDTLRASGTQLDPPVIDAFSHALVGAYEALAVWWRSHPDVAAEQLADWLVKFVGPGLRAALRGELH